MRAAIEIARAALPHKFDGDSDETIAVHLDTDGDVFACLSGGERVAITFALAAEDLLERCDSGVRARALEAVDRLNARVLG